MNEIYEKVEKLKEEIINSAEYKKYMELTKKLDDNTEVNEIINKIKKLQKEATIKDDKKESIDEIELELDMLYKKLDSIKEYNEYIESSKKLNELISNIQNNFSNCFNDIIN